ncbi:MAG: hypothetical protein KHZ73_07865 [Lachnospiraceae bacterium]|nr:hypothetical protein [Lachnospiraceae bacterium]
MEQKYSFYKIFGIWFVFSVLLLTINNLTWNSKILEIIVYGSFPVFLFIYPIYPYRLEWYWKPKTCRWFIRILAAVAFVFSMLQVF